MALDVVILDYGLGNLHSLAKALERSGAAPRVAGDALALEEADAIVLPGVGAFGEAVKRIDPLRAPLKAAFERGTPMLGVCLGMQLLFESSEESPGARGLGLIRGEVQRLKHEKLPQIGWNAIAFGDEEPLFEGLQDGAHVYYVNSFAPVPRESVTVATSTYGATFTAVVRKRNAWGAQFHPEKSSATGLTMIRNFVRYAEGHP